jgi:hypothetical protein
MTGAPITYRHTQRAPLCWILYGLALLFFVIAWREQAVPAIRYVFPVVGLLVIVLAASFHHLTVIDEGDRLAVQFGPLPLFRTSVHYDDIVASETGKTTWLDGWGIHKSFRGGWVWNLWGWDCVVLTLRKGTLRIGTDDADSLAKFLAGKRSKSGSA